MVARSGQNSVWYPKEVNVGHGCGIWKFILKGKIIFWKFIRFISGSSEEICFCDDHWVGSSRGDNV